jgi:hypothetical protein
VLFTVGNAVLASITGSTASTVHCIAVQCSSSVGLVGAQVGFGSVPQLTRLIDQSVDQETNKLVDSKTRKMLWQYSSNRANV